MELNEYLLTIKRSKKTFDVDLRVVMAAMDRDVSPDEFQKITEVAHERARELQPVTA